MFKALPRPWIIAHRGLPLEAPENTLASFEAAIQQGADLIELDIHLSADEQLVVIHDDTLDRTTNGTGPVRAHDLAALRALDAGSWMGSGFAGLRIPTLLEVLELTHDRVGLVIEIKVGSRTYPGIEQTLVNQLRHADRLQDTLIISGDCDAITAVKLLEPRLTTLCFRHATLDALRSETRHADVLFAWPHEVSAALVQEAHTCGAYLLSSLLAEPALDPQALRQLASTGVDGVFTNEAGLLRRLWRAGG